METMNLSCEDEDCSCERCGERFPEEFMVRESYQEDHDSWGTVYYCKTCHKGPEVDESYRVFPSDDPMDDIPF